MARIPKTSKTTTSNLRPISLVEKKDGKEWDLVHASQCCSQFEFNVMFGWLLGVLMSQCMCHVAGNTIGTVDWLGAQ